MGSHAPKTAETEEKVIKSHLHPTSVKEHVQLALDACSRLASLRDVHVAEALHACVLCRSAGKELILEGCDTDLIGSTIVVLGISKVIRRVWNIK